MGSVFSHHKTVADRSASDRRRHKKKIEQAIKDGIHDIVAEESIIGQSGKKKIRIPVKGIKEYKFVYGKNSNGTGSGGDHDLQKGQVIKKGKKKQQPGPENKPGNKPGQEYYDVEVTLEELADYLFADLELPDLEKKSLKSIVAEKWKRKGYRSSGIRPRLSKKETAKQRIRRMKAVQREEREQGSEESEDFPFIESDLKYKNISKTTKNISNAAIFFVMDVSGSMTKHKKYLARSFFFLLYHFIRSKYEKTELVFVAHDTQPYEVDEDRFFNRGTGGGTLVSPTLEYVYGVINKRFNPAAWNIYTFHCSDGDNWLTDNAKALEWTKKLADICQLYGYCEIDSEQSLGWMSDNALSNLYEGIHGINTTKIKSKTDVWKSFKEFFSKNQD
jgi:sporulation protein YhbH